MNHFARLLVISLCILSSCVHNPNNHDLAVARLLTVRQLVEQGRWNQAKIELDSIHLLYPQEVAVRRDAQKVSDSLFCLEAHRNMEYADSVKNVLRPRYEEMAARFVHRVNATYPDQSYFIHRTLTYISDDQTHISASVYDNSEVLLRSVWVGNDLNHVRLTLRVGDLQQSAEGSLHVTQDLARRKKSVKIEVLTISGSPALDMLHYVDLNRTQSMQVRLSGEHNASYTMSQNIVEALSETYEFAILLRDIQTAEQQSKRAKGIIDRYEVKNQSIND